MSEFNCPHCDHEMNCEEKEIHFNYSGEEKLVECDECGKRFWVVKE